MLQLPSRRVRVDASGQDVDGTRIRPRCIVWLTVSQITNVPLSESEWQSEWV
jgi:hypothetical protein